MKPSFTVASLDALSGGNAGGDKNSSGKDGSNGPAGGQGGGGASSATASSGEFKVVSREQFLDLMSNSSTVDEYATARQTVIDGALLTLSNASLHEEAAAGQKRVPCSGCCFEHGQTWETIEHRRICIARGENELSQQGHASFTCCRRRKQLSRLTNKQARELQGKSVPIVAAVQFCVPIGRRWLGWNSVNV